MTATIPGGTRDVQEFSNVEIEDTDSVRVGAILRSEAQFLFRCSYLVMMKGVEELGI